MTFDKVVICSDGWAAERQARVDDMVASRDMETLDAEWWSTGIGTPLYGPEYPVTRDLGDAPCVQDDASISLIRIASTSISKGLVSTCMPGNKWPLPIRLFSA